MALRTLSCTLHFMVRVNEVNFMGFARTAPLRGPLGSSTLDCVFRNPPNKEGNLIGESVNRKPQQIFMFDRSLFFAHETIHVSTNCSAL